jgi:hypothetical protein
MTHRLRILLAAALLTVFMTGCATGPTPATREAILKTTAELIAEFWSAGPGSPRSAIAQEILRPLFEDPQVQEAFNRKPFLSSAETYWNKLEAEGLALLPDEELRRGVTLRLSLLRGATKDECASYLAVNASGAWLGPEGKSWRQRLARTTDVEFATALRLQVEAIRTRARRLAEPAFSLSQAQYARALGQLALSLPREAQDRITAAMERGIDSNPAANAAEACEVAVDLLTAQESATGNALRVFFVQPTP